VSNIIPRHNKGRNSGFSNVTIVTQIILTILMSKHRLLLFKYFRNCLEDEPRIENIASRHTMTDEDKLQILNLECKYSLYIM